MNNQGWRGRKAWADGYLPQVEIAVRAVAGQIIEIREGTEDEDRKEATDYVVHVASGTIACRVRDDCKYRDLTLRASLPSGAKTELAKIKEGWGRWYLYMWVNGDRVDDWIFVDLDKLRASGLLEDKRRQRNPDGVTFLPLPAPKLVAAGCMVRGLAAPIPS